MLQAPTSDRKTKAEASSKTAEYLPEYEQSSHLMGGMGRSRQSQPLQQRENLAALQKVYGNQAVLRMKGRSTAANSEHKGVLQRKCACGNSAGSSGSCAECQSKQEGILQTKLQIGEPGDKYEQESDHIADEVISMPNSSLQPHRDASAKRFLRRQIPSNTPTESPTAIGDDDFMRSHFCLTEPDPSNPTRHAFTERERQRASFGLWNARSIATRAFVNLGHRDPYHLRMAERAFDRPVPFEVLDQHTRRIRSVLDNLHIDQNLFAATCDDSECNTGRNNAVAVTLDDLSAVVLCPFYFIQPARTLATTFLHEAGHMAGIDANWTPGSERYCRGDDTIECDNICPLSGENLLENVDAWSRFLYCLSASG